MKSKLSAHQILRVGINPSFVAVAGNVLMRERLRVFLLLVRSNGGGGMDGATTQEFTHRSPYRREPTHSVLHFCGFKHTFKLFALDV